MTVNHTVNHIQVSVGNLPEWYVEEQHDTELEFAIEANWSKAYPEATVGIEYNYQTDNAIVTAYDDDGNVVFERDHDLTYAFNAVTR